MVSPKPAPDETQCLAALRAVQELPTGEFERALTDEIGESMIQVMNAVVRALHPNDDDDAVHKKLHLMMVSFLLARRS
jgi:hypothetical protein